MFYLSEVIGKPVRDHQGNPVARIRDLVAEVAKDGAGFVSEDDTEQQVVFVEGGREAEERDVPVIKGVLARAGRMNRPFYVPVDQIGSLGTDGARLRSARVDLQPFERHAGEMLLTRDLWDKQVIDLGTRKVVRVNDIVLTQAKASGPKEQKARWWVRGVDVGIGGLVRRLRLGKTLGALNRKAVQPRIVPWRQLDVFGSNVPGGMALPHGKLAGLHPVEIARITDSVSYLQGAEIIASLDDALAADTLEEIVTERQTDIMEIIPDERAVAILEEMDPDEATDLLAELPEEKAAALLEQMDEEEAQEVRQLLRYPEHSAGGIMTTDFVMVLPTMTVDQVMETCRQALLSADLIYYMYVVDSEETCALLGVITVRDLLVHDRGDVVGDFMLKDLISVRPGEREQEVARKMAEYNLLALPVVDKSGVLLGVVTVDDALDVLLPEGWKKRLPRIFS